MQSSQLQDAVRAPSTLNPPPGKALAVSQDVVRQVDKWKIGFLSVDLKGRPIIDKSRTGGWRAAPFIFGNEMAEKMVYYGLTANFVTYLVFVMHQPFTSSATILSNWAGTSNITPLLGGFMADAFWGRYWTICVASMIYMLGLILLTIQAVVPSLHPAVKCNILQVIEGVCPPPSKTQMNFLYLALYVIALGAGGLRPLVAPFGADQFDVYDPKEEKEMSRFFNMFYFFFSGGILFAVTVVVYVSNLNWGWGIGMLAIAMFVSSMVFLIGTPTYRHKMPSGSPLTRVFQVIAAAFRKRSLPLPLEDSDLHEVYDRESAILGSGKLQHTSYYKFLDKAAVETEEEKHLVAQGLPVSPWRLCTVTQVEELKAIFNFVPIWFTSIVQPLVLVQIISFSVQQAGTMNRNLGPHFTIPTGSAPASSMIVIMLVIPAYDWIYVPLMRKWTGHQRGTTVLQRIGIGYFILILCVMAAGFVEHERRAIALRHPELTRTQAPLPFSVLWITCQFSLLGISEVFSGIGQIEFFYDQAPDGMRGVGGALLALAMAVGNFASTLVINIVKKYTGGHGKEPWLTNDINSGHLDYYYWMLAVLSFVNLLAFMVVSSRYKYKVQTDRSVSLAAFA